MFKEFDNENISPIVFNNRRVVSVSNDSPCASDVHFFTGVRSLGKIKFFDVNKPASFGLTLDTEIKYQFLYDKSTIPGSSFTAERTSGIFLSDADQVFQTSTNAATTAGHQAIFNWVRGYLYRNDKDYVNTATTALNSASTAISIGTIRLISTRRNLHQTKIQPGSIRLEMNVSNTSATGVITGTATGLVSALDIKNSFIGYNNKPTINSYFSAPWNHLAAAASAEGSAFDSLTSAMTIEAIIRPYDYGVILWRRLSSSGWAQSNVESQNAFMKLELTKSADNREDAFRFYIRSVTANGQFSEDFATQNVQASGLFVPEDAGVNIFDGHFHHIIVSWGVSGIDNTATTVESGAGNVFGYIDGYKLLNREQTEPRLGGEDAGGGPVIQANMFEQRVPIKTTTLSLNDIEDAAPSGNSIFLGISNYNRELNDTTGDRTTPGPLSADGNVEGQWDGQIQSLRMWNIRFNDGSTGVKDNIGQLVSNSTCAGISFNNFHNGTLTGSSNLVAWWLFNEINTTTADDRSSYSNSGTLYGRTSINLYDEKDNTLTGALVPEFSDLNLSAQTRTFLYFDKPESNIINKDIEQGRIVRAAFDGTEKRVGTVFYDLGIIALDADDENAKLNFLWPSSGTTGDFGFSVTGNLNSAINIERYRFVSLDVRGRLLLDSVASGSEFNFSQNPTALNPETGENNFDEPQSYINSVGLYNDDGELLAVAKLSQPVRKDTSRRITLQTKVDF